MPAHLIGVQKSMKMHRCTDADMQIVDPPATHDVKGTHFKRRIQLAYPKCGSWYNDTMELGRLQKLC